MNLLDHLEVCTTIGERAFKEHGIRKMLTGMKDEWKEVIFEIVLHKETASGIYYKIKTFEEIGNLLDDHIVNTQMMAFSPFKAHFEEEISEWENNLRHMLDVLEEWMKV